MAISKIKVIVLFILLCITVKSLLAQDPTNIKSDFNLRDKIFVGGNLGLFFGRQMLLEVSPHAGYKILPKWSAGIGFSYMYYKDYDIVGNNTMNVVGGRIFSRYVILNNIFAYTEYEVLSREMYDPLIRRDRRINIPALYLGGGYQQPISEGSSMYVILLWNTQETRFSLFQNPVIKGGVNIGLGIDE